MKNIIKISCLALAMQLVGCTGFLDTESREILTDDTVWENEDGIRASLVNLYDNVEFEDLGYQVNAGEATYMAQGTDEAVQGWETGNLNAGIPDGWLDRWDYGAIRNVNLFLQGMATSTVAPENKAHYIAEGRFLRAFHYFNLVKRYGGVPLITEPQHYTGDNVAELQVPRDTEKTIWEFIRTECDAIAGEGGLPESWDNANMYRATRYSALALKARAMLYAASIAKYGTVQLDGLVGVPTTDANFYFTESMNAADAIIKSDKYELYRENIDKAANFAALFRVNGMSCESIFTVPYLSTGNTGQTHYFDIYNCPLSFAAGFGLSSATQPTLQLVEEFEYVDGSEGTLKVTDPDSGLPIQYANPFDLFNNKDPRLHATVMLPFTTWRNSVIETRKGIMLPDETLITAANTTDVYGTAPNAITIAGKDGFYPIKDGTKTGFYVRKHIDPVGPTVNGLNCTDVTVMRYAEVLLNYAEAAVELGQNTDKALEYINDIRDRAGIKLHTSIDLEKVRKERRVELAFENLRWWDIMRWHKGADILGGFTAEALQPYLVWEEGKLPSEMKYIFKVVTVESYVPNNPPKSFQPKMYYQNIPFGQRMTNPNLIMNPYY